MGAKDSIREKGEAKSGGGGDKRGDNEEGEGRRRTERAEEREEGGRCLEGKRKPWCELTEVTPGHCPPGLGPSFKISAVLC